MPLRVLSAFNLKKSDFSKIQNLKLPIFLYHGSGKQQLSRGWGLILDLLGTLLTALVTSKSQELHEVTSQEVGF